MPVRQPGAERGVCRGISGVPAVGIAGLAENIRQTVTSVERCHV